MSTKLQATTERIAGHIRQPLSADEIAEKIDSGDYGAELMLQHVLLLASRLEDERNHYREMAAHLARQNSAAEELKETVYTEEEA